MDIWAVGSLPFWASSTSTPFVERFDGKAWTSNEAVPVRNAQTIFNSVSVLNASDVWAVGTLNVLGVRFEGLTEHWSGATWSVVNPVNPVPKGDPNYFLFNSVLALSSRDVWAAGAQHRGSGRSTQSLIEHWDGSAWSVVASPNIGNPATGFLHGLSGIASNDVWAVGDGGGGSPLVAHWDGVQWSGSALPIPGFGGQLNAVAEIAPNDVWAVGSYVDQSRRDVTLTERWDGASWKRITSPNATGRFNTLLAVSRGASSDVWAVGYTQDTSTTTLAEHWNGSGWSIAPTANPSRGASADNRLAGVLSFGSSNVVAVGQAFPTSLVEEYCR